mgnify:CR=1 FL=1
MSKVEKIRIGLLVGGYSIPAIPTQSTENEGRVGRAGMPYPPTFVAFNKGAETGRIAGKTTRDALLGLFEGLN